MHSEDLFTKARLLREIKFCKMKNIVTKIKKNLYLEHGFGHDKLEFETILLSKPKIKKMRLKFFLTMAILIAISFTGFTQNRQHAPNKTKKALQQVTAFSGQLVSWTNNEDYLYDGFYLQTLNYKYLVKFPPNKANQLMMAIKTDSIITVKGVEKAYPYTQKEIKLVAIIVSGKNIYDSILFKKDLPAIEEFFQGQANIKKLQKDRRGKINGFILDNNTVLRMPAHVAKDLTRVAEIGTKISYTGIRKGLHFGEVAAVNDTIIHCKTITINKIQYLTK